MTDAGDASAPATDASIARLNLELERTRLELRETLGAIEDRVNLPARFRRWRERATGVDRAYPAAMAAGVAILIVAAIGVVGVVRSRRTR